MSMRDVSKGWSCLAVAIVFGAACGNPTTVAPPTVVTVSPASGGAPSTVGPFRFEVSAGQDQPANPYVSYRVTNMSAAHAAVTLTCTWDARIYTKDAPRRLVYSRFAHSACAGDVQIGVAPGEVKTFVNAMVTSQILAAIGVAGTYELVGTLPGVSPEVEVKAGEITLQ